MKLKWFAVLSLLSVLVVTFPNIVSRSHKGLIAQPQPETLKAYQAALLDAADPQPNEMLNNLTAIDHLKVDNQGRVLVVTFTKKGIYEKEEDKLIVSKPNYEKVVWVTMAPELKDFCQQYKEIGVSKDELNLRLKQLLGLPSEGDYVEIAEIRVHPKYLKRPTIDPEINDSTVQLIPKPPQDTLPFSDSVDKTYQEWFQTQIETQKSQQNPSSNLERLTDNNPYNDPYPWTGLGYTYDWGIYPKTELQTDAGLSEFIIFLPPNSPTSPAIEVTKVLPTEQYCQ